MDKITEMIFNKDNAEDIKKVFSEFVDEIVVSEYPMSKFKNYRDFFGGFPEYYFAKKTFKDQSLQVKQNFCCSTDPRIELVANYKLTDIDYIKVAEGEILKDGKAFYFTKKFHVTPFNLPSIPEKLDIVPKVSKYLMAGADRGLSWASTIEESHSLLITQLKMYMNLLPNTQLYIRGFDCSPDDRFICGGLFKGYCIAYDWVLIK